MNPLRTHRVYADPPAAVFAAITTPQRLARWWGPNGFSNEFAVCDLRTGGAWQFDMIGPDGKRYHNVSVFEVIEPHRVVIHHTSPPVFRLTITLTPEGTGTRVDWEQAFADDAVASAVASICIPANEQNLDRLGAELAV